MKFPLNLFRWVVSLSCAGRDGARRRRTLFQDFRPQGCARRSLSLPCYAELEHGCGEFDASFCNPAREICVKFTSKIGKGIYDPAVLNVRSRYPAVDSCFLLLVSKRIFSL
jgi:hypothetical protein